MIGGSGYVGLITGLGLAELGNEVTGVDIDPAKIEMLNQGHTRIYEETIDLNEVLRRNLQEGRIRFTTGLSEGEKSAQVIFIAVGTPEKQDGEGDFSQVINAAEDILKYTNGYQVIVIKSTVPIEVIELCNSIFTREKVEGEDFDIVSNPEFLREGRGFYDFFHQTRIVIGTGSQRARNIMRQLYAPLTGPLPEVHKGKPDPQFDFHNCDYGKLNNRTPLLETDINSAQMIKYASNAFLATRISFCNEIASICERVGADIKEVTKGMGYDPRIGSEYLEAGIGFGGPCLEKDL